ncbi:MAG: 30S ribosomal protein S4 [Nanoarchaeota archaeon]|nr:30S ribosomal protein S4 [DPANN group archaeon]MBL7116385.1 30S ribosomal protein S4 [Nanoarchaeota archaeon]
MGDPKKIRKKYSTPTHPWQKDRIEEEIALKKEYGLKNKREIWVVASKLNKFKDQFKTLNAQTGTQAEKEKEQLKDKLLSLGLIKTDSPLGVVLGLDTKDLMERRLQTIVFRKNLARSINQARQFIVHRHIIAGGKKVTSPSYIVKVGEENQVSFVQTSTLSDPSHPERYEEVPKGRGVKKKKEEKKKEEVPVDEEEIVKEIDSKKEEPKDPEVKQTEESKEESAPKKRKKLLSPRRKKVKNKNETINN